MQQISEKLSITLTSEMVRCILENVSGGGYASNSEVIREAMRAWMEKEKRLLILDAAIARGLADSESGRGRDIDTVRQDFVKRYAQ